MDNSRTFIPLNLLQLIFMPLIWPFYPIYPSFLPSFSLLSGYLLGLIRVL